MKYYLFHIKKHMILFDLGGEYIRDAFEHEQYAVDAFRLHVSDFWLYPYTAENEEEAFHNLRHTPEKGSQFS